MFDQIAPTYDRLNHFFTFKLDTKWRRDIVKFISKQQLPCMKVLDLASGTGDMTIELLKTNSKEIYAADISKKMLEIQRKKIQDSRLRLTSADACELPFVDGFFDIVTICFGIRNFEKLEDSLKEIKRVLKPEGKLIILEMFKSERTSAKFFNLYFGKLMPFIGNKISKSDDAYTYLFESVNNFFTADEFISLCVKNGFRLFSRSDNLLGIVNTLYFNNSG